MSGNRFIVLFEIPSGTGAFLLSSCEIIFQINPSSSGVSREIFSTYLYFFQYGLLRPEVAVTLQMLGSNRVLEQKIRKLDQLSYLGAILEKNMSFLKHIKHVVSKATEKQGVLTGLIPKIGGPRHHKKRVL